VGGFLFLLFSKFQYNYYPLFYIIDAALQGISPPKITAHINERVVLIVKAFQPGTAVWHFNGEILPFTNSSKHFRFPGCLHYGIAHGAVLQIRDIRLRHTGNYLLTYNVSGCIRHHEMSVEVLKENEKGKFLFIINLFAISDAF